MPGPHILRYIARAVLSVFVTLLFIFALLSGAEQQGGGVMGVIKNSPNALPWLLLLVLVYVAWRWELLGGALIIVFGIGAVFSFNLLEQEWLVFSIIGLPLFVLGGMFIAAHFLDKGKREVVGEDNRRV
jgi:hypothetical protein